MLRSPVQYLLAFIKSEVLNLIFPTDRKGAQSFLDGRVVSAVLKRYLNNSYIHSSRAFLDLLYVRELPVRLLSTT